jgi:hypothetical protein
VTTIRRTYAYLLAFAGLTILALAVANLAQLLVDLVLQAPLASTERYVRDTASLSGAAALVGLPAWLLHWLWIQRSARSEPTERTSVLRGLYLHAILGGAALAIGLAVHDLLRSSFDALLGGNRATGFAPTVDLIVRPLPFVLVGLLVWFGHWRVGVLDRQITGESGGTATLRRWYVYGAALIGLLMLLDGARELLERLWVTMAGAAAAGAGFADPAATTLVGLGVWVVHWVAVPARLPEAARREDGTAVLRSVYLFVALAVSVIATLSGGSQLLYYIVARLLGVQRPGGMGGDLLQTAAGPVSTALVYGAAWAYQRHALGRQAALFAEAPRQAGIRRLYMYLIALLALSVVGVGAAGLLWTLGDVLFSPGAAAGDYWRERVALFATLTIVGLPVWLLYWRPSSPTIAEAHSLARRIYVYLSLIVAALTLIGSLAGALYRLIGLALGERLSSEVATDLAHALGVACVATAVGAYHWRILRADARHVQPLGVSPQGPAQTAVALDGPAQAVVEIEAADADALVRAISALRATGVQVTVRQPQGQPPTLGERGAARAD